MARILGLTAVRIRPARSLAQSSSDQAQRALSRGWQPPPPRPVMHLAHAPSLPPAMVVRFSKWAECPPMPLDTRFRGGRIGAAAWPRGTPLASHRKRLREPRREPATPGFVRTSMGGIAEHYSDITSVLREGDPVQPQPQNQAGDATARPPLRRVTTRLFGAASATALSFLGLGPALAGPAAFTPPNPPAPPPKSVEPVSSHLPPPAKTGTNDGRAAANLSSATTTTPTTTTQKNRGNNSNRSSARRLQKAHIYEGRNKHVAFKKPSTNTRGKPGKMSDSSTAVSQGESSPSTTAASPVQSSRSPSLSPVPSTYIPEIRRGPRIRFDALEPGQPQPHNLPNGIAWLAQDITGEPPSPLARHQIAIIGVAVFLFLLAMSAVSVAITQLEYRGRITGGVLIVTITSGVLALGGALALGLLVRNFRRQVRQIVEGDDWALAIRTNRALPARPASGEESSEDAASETSLRRHAELLESRGGSLHEGRPVASDGSGSQAGAAAVDEETGVEDDLGEVRHQGRRASWRLAGRQAANEAARRWSGISAGGPASSNKGKGKAVDVDMDRLLPPTEDAESLLASTCSSGESAVTEAGDVKTSHHTFALGHGEAGPSGHN